MDISDVPGHSQSAMTDVGADDQGDFSVSWVDNGDIEGSGTDMDIYLRRFNGALEATAFVVSANSDGISTQPVLRRDALGNSHVVWYDASNLTGTIVGDGDTDIFYMATGQLAP
jgi:hypothetical protein